MEVLLKIQRLLSFCLLLALVLAACSRNGEGNLKPSPINDSETLIQEGSATTPMATSSPSGETTSDEATAASLAPGRLYLGVEAGDAYQPTSVSVDKKHGLAYIYNTGTPEGDSAISVVDLAEQKVLRRVRPARFEGATRDGKLLVTPDGAQGYLLDASQHDLYSYEPQTDQLALQMTGILDVLLAPDAGRVVLVQEDQVSVWPADLQEPIWQVTASRPGPVAVNAAGVLVVSKDANGEELAVYDLDDGAPSASAAVPDSVDGGVGGPEGDWFVQISGQTPKVWRLDGNLVVQAEATGLYGQGLYWDAPRQRLLISGLRPGQPEPGQSRQALMALAYPDLSITVDQPWPDQDYPTVFATSIDEGLVGISEWGEDRLYHLDPRTLAPSARTILGVRLRAMALDEERGRLYVADNQERIQVVNIQSGGVEAIWPGMAPIAIDTTNQRLYVNRRDGLAKAVVALDSQSGDLLTRYARAGVPAPDPQRDLVYIAGPGVTLYRRSGEKLGQLGSTFPDPQGFTPNPSAFAAVVNPVSGYLAVFINNGVPGSNNRNYLHVFPPAEDGVPVDKPIEIPAPDNLFYQYTFDPQGNLYLTYNSHRGGTALQKVGPQGKVLALAWGRTGNLVFDPRTETLAVVNYGALAQFDSDLSLQQIFTGPKQVEQVLLNAQTGQLYYRPVEKSYLRIEAADDLSPFVPGPGQTASELPAEWVSDLLATTGPAGEPLLFAVVQGRTYRSGDGGQSWTKLVLNSFAPYAPPTVAKLSAATDSTLFYASSSSLGGDGVLRSQDGGESWSLLFHGLRDLRTYKQTVLANGRDEAYFVSQNAGLFAWQPAQSSWTQRLEPEEPFTPLGTFFLAPDGTLFRQDYQLLARSDDQGVTWQNLSNPEGQLRLLGFSSNFTRDQTLYGLLGENPTRFARSQDGGQSWTVTASLPVDDGTLLQRDDTLYLYWQTFQGQASIFRSQDNGDSWDQLADTAALQGTTALALDPDGRFWLGDQEGNVRSLAQESLNWTAVAQEGSAAPAQPTPCAQTLSGNAAQIAQQFPALGCPQGDQQFIFMARQPFQNGQMVWRSDTRTIYVLNDDRTWRSFPDTFEEGQAESDPSLTPPPNLFQPVRGFGKVWREQLRGPDAAIGWATAPEQGANNGLQEWQNGLLLSFGLPDRYVLLNDGTWQRVE